MLAEIHGKFDPTALDLVERGEDSLTDAVFGSIRHLPRREILGALLAMVGVEVGAKDLSSAEVRLWPTVPMPQWGRIIEPDVIVIAGRSCVVFEAKLHSEFGLYPRPEDDGVPFHQLAVQYAAVRAWATGERLDSPIVVAVTAGAQPPDADLVRARADLERLVPGCDDAAAIRWSSWRAIAGCLEQAAGLRLHEQQLISDVLTLMDKRGVRRMFTGFQPEDYWLISAAQRVASDRVYPQIRTFVEDLAAALDEDGIAWSQPAYRSMWLGLGASLSKPTDWTRSFVGSQFWPSDWPLRTKSGANIALYALFDFVDPALEVGLSVLGPGAAAAQQHWTPHLASLAAEVAALPAEFDVAFDNGEVSRPSKVASGAQVDVDWLASIAALAVANSHLRVRMRLDPLTLTVQQAREGLQRVRSAVEACPTLWTMLRAGGQLAVD